MALQTVKQSQEQRSSCSHSTGPGAMELTPVVCRQGAVQGGPQWEKQNEDDNRGPEAAHEPLSFS